MKRRWRLHYAWPGGLEFFDANDSSVRYRLERWRWIEMCKGYWPGVPA